MWKDWGHQGELGRCCPTSQSSLHKETTDHESSNGHSVVKCDEGDVLAATGRAADLGFQSRYPSRGQRLNVCWPQEEQEGEAGEATESRMPVSEERGQFGTGNSEDKVRAGEGEARP